MLNEKMYQIPCAAASDSAAIQAAIDEASRTDLRTVVIPAKADGSAWLLDAPVRLPNHITLILDGAVIRTRGIAFMNASADKPETRSLGGEQYGLTILGAKGAVIIGGTQPQLLLCNVRDFTVKGLTFEDGAGIRLTHARKGTLQDLRFSASHHGIRLEEGCISLLLMDIDAKTEAEAVLWSAGDTTVWGRSPEISHSSLCRLRAKTKGAPAVAVRPGPVTISNLILRDVTDETNAPGFSVELGDDGETELRDISVRGVVCHRGSVCTSKQCDGIYLGNLQAPQTAPEATRVFLDQAAMAVELPQPYSALEGPFVSANDPAYLAASDADTLQNAVNDAAARGACLVIPRHNARTGAPRWDIDRAVRLPSHARIALLDAHLRMTDYTYTNLFVSGPGAADLCILGVGSATLDSGIPNGLKEKNANTMGFGPITDNATILLDGVDGFSVGGLHMEESRWYGLCCKGCTNGHIHDIRLYAPPIFPNLGGVQLQNGCREILIENITGLSGEDMIRMEGSEEEPVSAVHVRNAVVNSSRCCTVNLADHCREILVETLMDDSLPEQKKQPWAGVRVGEMDGQVRSITVRDVLGRGNAVVELGGSGEHVDISNIHGFGTSGVALQSFPSAEASEFVLIGITAQLAEAARKDRTQLQDCHVSGVFFRCQQASRYMRGTATSIITNKKHFVGAALVLRNVQAENFLAEHVLAERIGNGIKFTGEGTVTVSDFTCAECGREEAQCSPGCTLTVNGAVVPPTESVPM